MVSFWTSRNSWKGLMKWVYPSFCPSVLLFILLSVFPSGCFLGIISLDISKFWHGARNPYEVVCDTARISRKFFFAPNIRKMGQKWARVFWIYWKVLSVIFTEFVLSWNLYCLLCSYTNPIFGKSLAHEIWTKMFSPNQIVGIL